MAYNFKFPDVGEGITEGTIVAWKVKNGDKVKADQTLVDIETDKAIVDIPCPETGIITKITHKEGEIIKVGELLCIIEDESEYKNKKNSTPTEKSKKEVSKEDKKSDSKKSDKKSDVPYTGSVVGFLDENVVEIKRNLAAGHQSSKDHVRATFRVRTLAKKLGVDLSKIKGSGNRGRITEDDVRNATKKKKKPVLEYPGEVKRVPFRGIRKTISDHLLEAQHETVMVTNFHEIDVTNLWNTRKKEKVKAEKKGVKLTFMPYIIEAVTKALQTHPYINASIDGDDMIFKGYYNIGVAVDTPDGLMVPVIKDTGKKDLYTVAKEIVDLATRAKNRKLSIEELRGGSFSITNLGSIGVSHFTPILNYPESAILGVGSIKQQVNIDEKGNLVQSYVMPLSLTFDHRIIDGAEAARFMKDVMLNLNQ